MNVVFMVTRRERRKHYVREKLWRESDSHDLDDVRDQVRLAKRLSTGQRGTLARVCLDLYLKPHRSKSEATI